MKQQRRFTALPILAALVFVCGPARADTVTIDCDDPNLPSSTPIQDTLAEGRVLVIQGICNTEPEIVIRFDDVTLVGDGTIVGQVTVGGAQRFALRNVTVANSPEIGVYIIDGASAEISNVTVENANDSGIDVRLGSFARILDSRIEHNIWVSPSTRAGSSTATET